MSTANQGFLFQLHALPDQLKCIILGGGLPQKTHANLIKALEVEEGLCSGFCWAPRAVCSASCQRGAGGGSSHFRATQRGFHSGFLGEGCRSPVSTSATLQGSSVICRHCSQPLEAGSGSLAHLGRRQPELWGHEKKLINLSGVTVYRSMGSFSCSFPNPWWGSYTEKRMGTSQLLPSHQWDLMEMGLQRLSRSLSR